MDVSVLMDMGRRNWVCNVLEVLRGTVELEGELSETQEMRPENQHGWTLKSL